MDTYCRGAICRHRALVQYFGQKYPRENCAACDICLGDTEAVPEAAVIAQKILSCVARVQERFGVGHVAGVLRGENTERIRSLGHDKLSTYGLLKEHAKPELRDWILQLVSQNVLVQEGAEYPILKLNEASWEVMRKERPVRLIQPVRRQKGEKTKASLAEAESWEGVERGLFDELRQLRRRLAEAKGVSPFIVFSDATLRELARVRPSGLEKMHAVYGIGQAKLEEYGSQVLKVIVEYCAERQVALDVKVKRGPRDPEVPKGMSIDRSRALEMFRKGASIEAVMQATGRARSTVVDYLCDFIRREKPPRIEAWVSRAQYDQVVGPARELGTARLKPIFQALEENVPYDVIRLVATHLEAAAAIS
jgi:ATP-dependent DNA helicase RecQ